VAEKRKRGKPAKLISPTPPLSPKEAGEDQQLRRKLGPKPRVPVVAPLTMIGPDGLPMKIRKKPGRKPKEGEPEGAFHPLPPGPLLPATPPSFCSSSCYV